MLRDTVSAVYFCVLVVFSESAIPNQLFRHGWKWPSPLFNYWFYLLVIKILMFPAFSRVNCVFPGIFYIFWQKITHHIFLFSFQCVQYPLTPNIIFCDFSLFLDQLHQRFVKFISLFNEFIFFFAVLILGFDCFSTLSSYQGSSGSEPISPWALDAPERSGAAPWGQLLKVNPKV